MIPVHVLQQDRQRLHRLSPPDQSGQSLRLAVGSQIGDLSVEPAPLVDEQETLGLRALGRQ